MFSLHKKTTRKGEENGNMQNGMAPMFTYRRSVFSKYATEEKPYAAVGMWFVGPKAENADIFKELMTGAIDSHFSFRQGVYPCDPPYVTDEVRQAQSFKLSKIRLKAELKKMQEELQKSVPFFSTRYKGHMVWDTAVPASLGYIASILWNQNNCTAEGGPVTAKYEVAVGSDLCEMIGLDREESMGHLVTGGSVANIEAMWVARNLKYYPLGLKEALLKEEQLSGASGYEIYLPQRGSTVHLVNASQWELLNLDTDTIIKMPFDVAKKSGLEQKEFRKLMGNHLYECIGAQEFCRRHKLLTNSPCVLVGSTYHMSFLKAVTILGLGKESLVTVPVDRNARLDSKKLEEILVTKMMNRIPVISVIGIMGTTEESAVDPLEDILAIRETLRKKGLNFSVHADAAWGAYFACMLRDPPVGTSMENVQQKAFVPELSLNAHVTKQLKALKKCDTVTCDPHKCGFCPYPAGAICFRDKNLNNFLNVSKDVLYLHGDITLGYVGIEGSKPGAAACAVLLANRVIGLHKDGYGRILAQCMFTSKILYCYWVCLAEDDDNFLVETTKSLPDANLKNFIRNNIIGKFNEDIAQDDSVMKILQEIGPDTLVPCFSVNIHGNTDVNLCNDIMKAIFKDLCYTSAEESDRRKPMIVTSSTMQDHKHSSTLEHFKERLGLNTKNKDGVKYIKTTCLDPWSTTMEFMGDLAAIMRTTILNAIGTVTDPPDYHSFVCVDTVNANKEVFVCYAGNFKQVQLQYSAVARLRFLSDKDMATFALTSGSESQPIVLRNTFSKKKRRLHDLLFDDSEGNRQSEKFDFYVGLSTDSSVPFMTADMKIVDVPHYNHFDRADDQYPDNAAYLLYGDVGNAYLFHTPTIDPDYLQIVCLKEAPTGLGNSDEKAVILKQGVDVKLFGVPGAPTIQQGKIVDPLADTQYNINFIGIQGQEVTTAVLIKRKIWFDGEVLNKSWLMTTRL